MGKKVSQTSVKISKKEREFNSLIRLLRPKVYITDCSSFKTLVQDLTGNGRSNISITTSSSSHPRQQHRVPVVDVEEYQVEPERSTSVDVSTDASFDSSELCNQQVFMNDQELNQLWYEMYSDDTTTNILEGSSPSTADQLVDMLPFQDLESWLLGTEPFDPFNNGYGQIDQEVIAAVYVFIQSLPNKMWLPTGFLFVAGIIKYAERTRTLYLASLDNFRESMLKKPDTGPNYAKLMEEYSSKLDAQLPTHIELTAERSKESRTLTYVIEKGDMENDIAVVRHAHHFFQIFKGLLVDLIFTFHERYESRVIFHDRTSEEAFKLISVELNFIYEALFTKVVVVHSKLGYLFRAISFGAVSVALVFFYKLEKTNLHGIDVTTTYSLLCGAIGLDSISMFMVIFSNWIVAAMNKSWQDSCILAAIFRKYRGYF